MAAGAATAMAAAAAAAAAPACVGGAVRSVISSTSSSSLSSSSSRLLPAGKCSLLFPIWKSAGNRNCPSCQGFSPISLTRAPRASALDSDNQPQSVPSAASSASETLLKSLAVAVSEGKVERDVSTKAIIQNEAGEAEVASGGGDSEVSEPTIVSLPKQSDIDKKLKKKAELRRRRLKRKRMLRKKGRWPPSKMAKLKNV